MSTDLLAASEIEVFRHQARTTHKAVRVNVEGLSQEDSLVQPTPAGNCMNWVVGHLVCIYDTILPLVGQKPVLGKEALARYARRTPPLQEPEEALEFADLLVSWDTASERVDAGLASLTPAMLSAPAPMSPSKNPNETVRSLLATIFFHQAYHAGQTGILRRLAGKKGAIA
ncbi:MAG: DinB family protein [Terriglobia bacterium]